jgi:hypothetical protein
VSVEAAHGPRPKRLAVPEHVQLSPPGRSAELSAAWPAATVVTIAGADHFLHGRGSDVVALALEWLPVALA